MVYLFLANGFEEIEALLPLDILRRGGVDVILPGGMPGAENLDKSRTVETALRVTHTTGGLLCAICAAPMVLGRRGYLVGKTAVCFPGFEKELTGAEISHNRVVRDGKIITAAGMGVAMEFGLEILKTLRGVDVADGIRRAILAV